VLASRRWPNAEEMYFYLSSLLKGKVHRRFAWSIGEHFSNAQFRSVMKNGITYAVGLSLTRSSAFFGVEEESIIMPPPFCCSLK
jgi:hypothetical protein